MASSVRTDLDKLTERARHELQVLERAQAEMDGKPAATRKAKPGPMRGSKRRKRKGGTRDEHALALVTANPGIDASAIAKTLKIQPNYVYRVLGILEQLGQVRKEGRRYYPVT